MNPHFRQFVGLSQKNCNIREYPSCQLDLTADFGVKTNADSTPICQLKNLLVAQKTNHNTTAVLVDTNTRTKIQKGEEGEIPE